MGEENKKENSASARIQRFGKNWTVRREKMRISDIKSQVWGLTSRYPELLGAETEKSLQI